MTTLSADLARVEFEQSEAVGFHPAIEFTLSLAFLPVLAIAYIGAWAFVLLMFFGLAMRMMK